MIPSINYKRNDKLNVSRGLWVGGIIGRTLKIVFHIRDRSIGHLDRAIHFCEAILKIMSILSILKIMSIQLTRCRPKCRKESAFA